MQDLVNTTINNLKKIKASRIDKTNDFSKIIDDEIVITIDNMIAVLKYEYFKKK